MAAAIQAPIVGPNDNRDLVDAKLQRFQRLENRRYTFEALWQKVAQICWPEEDIFFRNHANSLTQGENRNYKIFDSVAALALPRFAAVMDRLLTPPTQTWCKLSPYNPQAQLTQRVKDWLEETNRAMFALRYSPRANFASQQFATYQSSGAFGTAALFVDSAPGYPARYHACHMAEIYISENHVGIVDTIYRKFPMTLRQLGEKRDYMGWTLHNEMERALGDGRDLDKEFDILHVVEPRLARDRMPGRKDFRGMPFHSYYISMQPRFLLEESGYRTMPYSIRRYITGPREVYGRSPGIAVLPDAKTAQEVRKTMLRAAQRAAAPALLLPTSSVLSAFDVRSDSLNYGAVDDRGQPMVHPLGLAGNLPVGFDMEERLHKDINEAFTPAQIFQALMDHPNMTATQALILMQEQGVQLGPMMGRQQSEGLGPMVLREIDLWSEQGLLPPPPPEVVDAGGFHYKVEYTSPLNRLQRAEEGVGMMNWLQSMVPLAATKPEVLSIVDPVKFSRAIYDINGGPQDVLLDDDVIAAQQQQAAQQAQMANMVAAAPQLSGSIKNLADAANTAGVTPVPGVGANQG